MNSAKQLTTKLTEAGKSLVPLTEGNLVDKVWGRDRPAPPGAPIRIHKVEHAGESVQQKLGKLRKEMNGEFYPSSNAAGRGLSLGTEVGGPGRQQGGSCRVAAAFCRSKALAHWQTCLECDET